MTQSYKVCPDCGQRAVLSMAVWGAYVQTFVSGAPNAIRAGTSFNPRNAANPTAPPVRRFKSSTICASRRACSLSSKRERFLSFVASRPNREIVLFGLCLCLFLNYLGTGRDKSVRLARFLQ